MIGGEKTDERIERGPWTVEFYNGEMRLDSDDFEHDCCLLIRGDLGEGDNPYKRAWAEAICKVLNAAMPVKF